MFDDSLAIATLIDTLNSEASETGMVLSIRPAGRDRAAKWFPDRDRIDLGGLVLSALGVPDSYRQSDNGKAESADFEGLIQAVLFDLADKNNSRRGGTQGWSKARFRATPKVLNKWDISREDIRFHIKRAYRVERFRDEETGTNRERQIQIPGVFIIYDGTPEGMSKAD